MHIAIDISIQLRVHINFLKTISADQACRNLVTFRVQRLALVGTIEKEVECLYHRWYHLGR